MEQKKNRTYIPEIDPDPQVGLTHRQVKERLAAGWCNKPSRGAMLSEGQIVSRHVFTFFNLVFAVLAVVLVLVESSVKNFGFLGVVLINTAVGIVQEIRAKRAVEKLRLVAEQTLKTVRDGKYVEVKDRALVRDDIVLLSAGCQVCADCVVRTGQLQVNESLITGEPDPIEKNPGDELMSGSFVVAGRAAVQLVRVGDDSYAAKLAAEARKSPRAAKSEMMASLDKLIRFLSIVLVPLGVLYYLGEVAVPAADTHRAAEQTVAALVSMIPQGLYLLTSIALAASGIKLARQGVLVQDMNCIETLARVDVLCVDKTGTITEPGMAVAELIPLGGTKPDYAERVLGSLFAGEEPENDTAAALAEWYGDKAAMTCLRRIPFTSETKWSGGVFEEGAFLLGAPECIMGSRFAEIAVKVVSRSREGYRVLLVAGYEGDPKPEGLDADRVTPLALVLLKSRIRENAAQTFAYFAQQGVAVKVISGDDPATAARIAGWAGVPDAETYVNCEGLHDPEELARAAQSYTVFGRVTPHQKRELVKALRDGGHTVAMTGDGVNDVLAMRQADCAVAMASGAKAASQVAQLVLMDSDFAAMPHIVAEGRRVMGNIQRAAALFLVKNIFTMALVVTALFTSLIYPFQPVTLTVIMALTVGIPSFFFALAPNRERLGGGFMAGALMGALPAGLAGFGGVVMAQLLGWKFTHTQLATVCAAVVAAVGILALLQVSRPLTRERKSIMGVMGACLLAAFLLAGPVFGVNMFEGAVALWSVLLMAFAALLLWALTAVFERLKR